jgi:hypothetical protein
MLTCSGRGEEAGFGTVLRLRKLHAVLLLRALYRDGFHVRRDGPHPVPDTPRELFSVVASHYCIQ